MCKRPVYSYLFSQIGKESCGLDTLLLCLLLLIEICTLSILLWSTPLKLKSCVSPSFYFSWDYNNILTYFLFSGSSLWRGKVGRAGTSLASFPRGSLTNQRPVSRSRDQCWLIRGQYYILCHRQTGARYLWTTVIYWLFITLIKRNKEDRFYTFTNKWTMNWNKFEILLKDMVKMLEESNTEIISPI